MLFSMSRETSAVYYFGITPVVTCLTSLYNSSGVKRSFLKPNCSGSIMLFPFDEISSLSSNFTQRIEKGNWLVIGSQEKDQEILKVSEIVKLIASSQWWEEIIKTKTLTK